MTSSKFTDNYALLLKLLFTARKKAGLTQSQVARLLHKNQSYISKYENGERRLDVIEVIDIANVLGADPLEIIGDLLKGWRKKN